MISFCHNCTDCWCSGCRYGGSFFTQKPFSLIDIRSFIYTSLFIYTITFLSRRPTENLLIYQMCSSSDMKATAAAADDKTKIHRRRAPRSHRFSDHRRTGLVQTWQRNKYSSRDCSLSHGYRYKSSVTNHSSFHIQWCPKPRFLSSWQYHWIANCQ